MLRGLQSHLKASLGEDQLPNSLTQLLADLRRSVSTFTRVAIRSLGSSPRGPLHRAASQHGIWLTSGCGEPRERGELPEKGAEVFKSRILEMTLDDFCHSQFAGSQFTGPAHTQKEGS